MTILTQRADQACDAARGWLDPEDGDGMRRPRFVDEAHDDFRLVPGDPYRKLGLGLLSQ